MGLSTGRQLTLGRHGYSPPPALASAEDKAKPPQLIRTGPMSKIPTASRQSCFPVQESGDLARYLHASQTIPQTLVPLNSYVLPLT